jgi:predicted nuclease of predicted toxin-antitoxin system
MRFLVDVMLPRQVVYKLRELGFEANHVFSLGVIGSSDEHIWAYACSHKAVVVTMDKDYLDFAKRDPRAGLILLKKGNDSFETVLAKFYGCIDSLLLKLKNGEQVLISA